MNKTQTAQMLTIASMVDSRTVAPETVEAWHEILGDLDFDMAREAMTRHRRESTDYLMPAHIVAHYNQIEKERRALIRRAERVGLIEKGWPVEKPIPSSVATGIEEHEADRAEPRNAFERADYNRVRDYFEAEDERYMKWRGDGKPWRSFVKKIPQVVEQ